MSNHQPQVRWDVALARRLWDDHALSHGDIGERCGTARSSIRQYAKRNGWPERECDRERQHHGRAKTPKPEPKAQPLKRGASTLAPLPSLKGTT